MNSARFAPIFLVVAPVVFSFQAQEGRVQKPAAKVDFTHHSTVESDQDGKFKITNFIRNESAERPLSVKWEDAGILCTGSLQLPPGASDYGTMGGVVDKPALKDNTNISYGLTLQYLAYARIYVDPNKQGPKDNTRTSWYERRSKSGEAPFKIEVSSTLDDANKTAVTAIRVLGGLSLILQAGLLGDDPMIGDGWTQTPASSLRDFGLTEETESAASSWLDRTRVPFWDKRGSPMELAAMGKFSILESKTRGANEVSFRAHGNQLTLMRVFIAAFVPREQGLIGLEADMYLPLNTREGRRK